jgi:hypothetical protein
MENELHTKNKNEETVTFIKTIATIAILTIIAIFAILASLAILKRKYSDRKRKLVPFELRCYQKTYNQVQKCPNCGSRNIAKWQSKVTLVNQSMSTEYQYQFHQFRFPNGLLKFLITTVLF